jgi:integrase
MALLLYTGQRRSDVVKMGRQNRNGSALRVRQQKTGTELEIPVHATLQGILDATPGDNMTYLLTSHGAPFTPAGFGNWFHEQCVAAGLAPGLASHGLRKAACRRLAEAGCSTLQIMSITGHKKVADIETYVSARNQKLMASEAMAKIETETVIGKLEKKFANRARKPLN